MKLEQGFDKVVLTQEESFAAIKEAIERKFNRKVRGNVVITPGYREMFGGVEALLEPQGLSIVDGALTIGSVPQHLIPKSAVVRDGAGKLIVGASQLDNVTDQLRCFKSTEPGTF
jgi:hypothetical protein